MALALTVQDVTDDATALLGDYQALEVRVDDCPDADCTDPQAILDDLDALEASRTQLHADRATLNSCNCTALDAIIDDVDDLAGILRATTSTGGWNEIN